MRPKLVVVDLDETLVGLDLEISRFNRAKIAATRRRGTKITLATGRTFTTTMPFARQLGITLPLICYQGAIVRTARRVLRKRVVDANLVHPIIKYGFRERTQVAVYSEERVFFNKPLSHWGKEYLNKIEQVKEISLVDLRRFSFDQPVLKVMFIGYARKMASVAERANRRFTAGLTVTRSRPNLLEFTDRDASKGAALAYLASRLRVPIHETMAIGDGYNDVSMFRVAGFSVAVANAPRSVEAEADAVTDAQEDDGVARALDAYVLRRSLAPDSLRLVVAQRGRQRS